MKPRLILATHNAGKLHEFRAMLSPYFSEITSAGELGLPSPEETGATFHDNALLKAKTIPLKQGELALADDSGLCVNALGGQPGLYSARWAGPQGDFGLAIQRIQNELGDKTDRSASFISVLALIRSDGSHDFFEGRVNGTIAPSPRGDKGFHYDPIFIPKGDTRSFAEMDDAEKNALSHRGLAIKKLIDALK